VPVSGAPFEAYGGDTLCVLVHMGGETILLDCGTGALRAGPDILDSEQFNVLLSHPHVDHLLGIPFCPVFYDKKRRITFRAVPRGSLSARQQVEALMSPPLWPVEPEIFRAEVQFKDIRETYFHIGEVLVEVQEVPHPGGSSAFRLSFGSRSLVYMTDCELEALFMPQLVAFCRECDLLLCDGQFTDADYPLRRGWGHSSWSMAAALGEASRAKRTVLIHHAPEYNDDILDGGDRWLRLNHPGCSMGRCGEVFEL